MNDGIINVAIVGCGRQMRKNLLPFLERISGHRVVVCVDHDIRVAEAAKDLSGAERATTRADELDPDFVDAAVLALPPADSSQVARMLLERGIHCFIEKPAGSSPADIAQLQETALLSDAHSQVGFNFRFTDALQALRDRSQELRRRPSIVTIDFLSRHPSTPQWGRPSTMDSWIRDNGVHAFDMARWLLAAPVTAVSAHAIQHGTDAFFSTVWLKHEDGSLSVLRLGNRTERFVVGASVQGEEGTRITMPSLDRVILESDAGKPSGAVLHMQSNLDHGWGRSGFGPELDLFLQRCRGGAAEGAPMPSVADAHASAILADRALDDLGHRRGPASGAEGDAARIPAGAAGG